MRIPGIYIWGDVVTPSGIPSGFFKRKKKRGNGKSPIDSIDSNDFSSWKPPCGGGFFFLPRLIEGISHFRVQFQILVVLYP
jgi:hypothetical protein